MQLITFFLVEQKVSSEKITELEDALTQVCKIVDCSQPSAKKSCPNQCLKGKKLLYSNIFIIGLEYNDIER